MAYRFDDPSAFLYRRGALFLGVDQHGREIGITTEVHAITIGGSGAGKGSALLVPNARRWPGNLLCIDVKGENAILSWEARRAMGQKVGILDPFEQIPRGRVPKRYHGHAQPVPDHLRVSINPLAEIDPASPRARAALRAIGNGMVVAHDPKHMEWIEGARTLLAGVCAYVVADAPREERTFVSVRRFLTQPVDLPPDDDGNPRGLYADALRMEGDNRLGGLISTAGAMLRTAIESDRSMEKDFLGNARRATEWLDDEAIAKSLGHSTFRLADLKSGDASLFLVLPADYLRDYAGFLRLFVKSALSAMAVDDDSDRECLFLLDEFYSLGKLEELTEAAGRMRSAGAHLWPFLQGLGQLNSLYGQQDAQAFLTNADAHVFLGNDKDPFTLDYISKRLGSTTPTEIADDPPPQTVFDPRLHWRFGQETEDEAKERHRVEHLNAVARFNHTMRVDNRPRLSPQEIAQRIGKGAADKLARSMISFMPGGAVLNLLPAPYFEPARIREVPSLKPETPTSSPSTPHTVGEFERGLGTVLGFCAGMVVLSVLFFSLSGMPARGMEAFYVMLSFGALGGVGGWFAARWL